MTVHLPKLNFSLLVEITTNINDFSFMELHDVQVKNPGGGIRDAAASYDSSDEVPFNDRAVLDFGNLTVSVASASLRVIFRESCLASISNVHE